MKKLKRKISVMFLILFCMVVMGTGLLQTVRADESDFVIDGNGVLTEYKGSGGDVVIPDGVTAIGYYAFNGCSGLTSIIIPNSVTKIGYYAFNGCSGLTSITIPDSVTDIGGYAFQSCSSLSSINIPNGIITIREGTFSDCNISNIIIPDSVTDIYYGAFYECNNLTSIIIPNKVTHIDFSAFYGCNSLSSITLSDNLTFIGNGAFYNCSSLTSITIPASVTNIGNGSSVFQGCDKLTSIYIYSDNVDIYDNMNALGNKDITTLYANKGSTTEAYANKYGYKFVELPPDIKPLESISLNKPTITLDIGRTSLLSVLYHPADTTDSKSVKWSSSNPEIAIVYSNGKVKAVSTGTATITATVGDKTATCTVTVK